MSKKKIIKKLTISFEEVDGILNETLINTDFSPIEILGLLERMKINVIDKGFGPEEILEKL